MISTIEMYVEVSTQSKTNLVFLFELERKGVDEQKEKDLKVFFSAQNRVLFLTEVASPDFEEDS